MNKQGKDGIEWCDYSWNPITGCLNDCFYCYAKAMFDRFGKSFKPQFHSERLEEPFRIKKPSRIFVGSVTDIFALWMKADWVFNVLEIIERCPQHTFLFLTKSPENYVQYLFPDNCWMGATVTGTEKGLYRIIVQKPNVNTFLSIEPFIKPIGWLFINKVRWVILGAMTGKYAKQYPVKSEWIEYILNETRRENIPLFMKSNLRPYWSGKLIQEYPE